MPGAKEPQHLMNSSDIAILMGVVPSALTNWKKRGKEVLPLADFTYSHKGEKAPLWKASTIRKWMETRETPRDNRYQELIEMIKESNNARS